MPYKNPADQNMWVKTHPDRIREINAKSYQKNRARVLEGIISWRKRNPGHAKFCQLVSGATKRGIPVLITRNEFIEWLLKQKQICSYCDLTDLSLDIKLPNNLQLTKLSVDRKNSDLPYTVENIVLACWFCNRTKGNVFTFDEWRQIAQTFVKPKWMKKLELADVV